MLTVLSYRSVSEACILQELRAAKDGGRQSGLWTAHTQVKNYFHRELKIVSVGVEPSLGHSTED